ncbi:hypothetical protein TKK_0000740 [Trichogramma kaykai]|uniref:Luciferin 4-monooxygenase n=1 Tax=Trichogramma kaykai TaxID=54128 RepID=A0ABD2WQ36_9HYME
MIVELPNKSEPNITIENNVIKGADANYRNIDGDFGDAIFRTLKSKPDHVAQIEAETGKKTTFGELLDSSVRCALWMKKQGIGPKDIVVYCTYPRPDTEVPVLATFFVGATYNGWSHQIALKSARYFLKFFEPKVIFAHGGAVDVLLEAIRLEGVQTRVIVYGRDPRCQSLQDILLESTSEEVAAFAPRPADPADTAIIVLSSGSTGNPKGIQHSYGNVMRMIVTFGYDPLDGVVMWYSTPLWITYFGFLCRQLFSYGTRIIHSSFHLEETCAVIEKYKVEVVFLTPTQITLLCKSDILQKYDLKSLKRVLVGGSKMHEGIFAEFKSRIPQAKVLQVFGMSEIGCGTAQLKSSRNSSSVGYLMDGLQMKVKDLQSGESLGPNKSGEICFKGTSLMTGYYKNPEATKDAFDEDGWFLTGDIGYYDENGEVYIVERIKEMIKCRNYAISPSDIEQLLHTHPGVMEAAVVPMPHEIDIERPIAFVIKAPGSNVTEEELVTLSAINGENEKLTGGVIFLEKLPKTDTGKIMRPYLKEKAKALAGNN